MCSLPSRAHLPFLPQSCRVWMVFAWGIFIFAKIRTTLWMHAVPLVVLEKWVENGGFNPECMADADYSCSTAILLMLTPDAQLNDIESMGIGLIVSPVWSTAGTDILHSSIN